MALCLATARVLSIAKRAMIADAKTNPGVIYIRQSGACRIHTTVLAALATPGAVEQSKG